MKKVLALVLALTMIVGFASTAMATYSGYTWNGVNLKYDLFSTEPAEGNINDIKVGDFAYTKGMSVDGNEEYKVKIMFAESDLNNFFGTTGTGYDTLAKEIRTIEAIAQWASFEAAKNWDWNGSGDAQDVGDASNELYKDVKAIWGGTAPTSGQSSIWDALYAAVNAEGNLYKAVKNSTYISKVNAVYRDWQNMSNGYFGLGKGIAVTATSKDGTYATITSPATIKAESNGGGTTNYTVEFKVKFTNTTFKVAEGVKVNVLMQAGSAVQGSYYEWDKDLEFDVYQAQARTFTAQDAQIAFGVTPNVEISAKDYAYISADAFRIMLQNSARTLTVVNGIGNSKIRFDSDSTNLPQDVFVGNFATSGTASTAASISGFSSTTAAKIKIAVGEAFKTAAAGKTLSVYDANNNKLNVEATLQGDNTVNFFAPLSNYTVATSDWAGQTVPVTDGKTNPSMGGK